MIKFILKCVQNYFVIVNTKKEIKMALNMKIRI